MSVNPGFGGQTFIPRSVDKIRARARAARPRPATRRPIEVDGGIDLAHRRATSSRRAPRCWWPARRSSARADAEARRARRCSAAAAAWRCAVPCADARRPRPSVRVRYAETDKMGVVYYANYLVWFEIGRTDWLRETGWTYRAMEAEGFALPVIEAHCEYKTGRPLRRRDRDHDDGAAGVAGAAGVRLRRVARRPTAHWIAVGLHGSRQPSIAPGGRCGCPRA